MLKDKFLVLCGLTGTLEILDLKKILADPEQQEGSAVPWQHFRIAQISSPDLCGIDRSPHLKHMGIVSYDLDRSQHPIPPLQVVDDLQIGLVTQFFESDNSELHTFDFC